MIYFPLSWILKLNLTNQIKSFVFRFVKYFKIYFFSFKNNFIIPSLYLQDEEV